MKRGLLKRRAGTPSSTQEPMLCSNCTCSISATGSPPILENADLLSFQDVTELNAELILLEKMARHFEERKMLLKHRMNASSPIGRLPEELFVQVFQECDATPFYLGSVCQGWRRIIWQTPLLWSSLSMHVRWNTGSTKCNLLMQWLIRAATAPLHIKITAGHDCDEALYGVIKVLVSRAAFWGSINCVVPAPANELLENCTFPMLTSITLRPASSTLTTFFTEPPKMFDATPCLVDLDLLGYNMPPEGVAWSRLRSLKSQALKVADLLDIMRCSTGLVECQARKVYGTTDEFGGIDLTDIDLDETLRHTNLTCLDVSLLSIAGLPLLDAITLPSLLRLKAKYHGPGSMTHSIHSLLQRSACQLRALEIEEPSFVLGDLIVCLKATPSLQDLSILFSDTSISPAAIGSRWGGELVRLMNPRFNNDPLLPLLTSFEYYGPLLCDVADLLDMLQHRRAMRGDCSGSVPDGAQAWIRSVNVTSVTTYNMTQDDSDHIRKLAQSKVSLTIRPVSIACQPQDKQRMRVINNALVY